MGLRRKHLKDGYTKTSKQMAKAYKSAREAKQQRDDIRWNRYNAEFTKFMTANGKSVQPRWRLYERLYLREWWRKLVASGNAQRVKTKSGWGMAIGPFKAKGETNA